MVVIRFQPKGRKNRRFFRIVAADSRSPIKGKFLEILGHFDPIKKDCSLDMERIEHWQGVGAQLSDSVAQLIAKDGKIEVKKRNKPNRKSVLRAKMAEEAKAQEAEAKKAQEEADKAAETSDAESSEEVSTEEVTEKGSETDQSAAETETPAE